MNLKTKNTTKRINLTVSEIGLIVENMYWNLANVTEDFTQNMKLYETDIELYKRLRSKL